MIANTAQVGQVAPLLTPYLNYLTLHCTQYRFQQHSHPCHCLLDWRAVLPNSHRYVQKLIQASVRTWLDLVTMLYPKACLTVLYLSQVLTEINRKKIKNISLCAVLEVKAVIINQHVVGDFFIGLLCLSKFGCDIIRVKRHTYHALLHFWISFTTI